MKNIKFILIGFLSFILSLKTFADEVVFRSKIMGPFTWKCENPGNWKFTFDVNEIEPGIEEIQIKMESDSLEIPPEFSISAIIPQKDMLYLWNAFNEDRNQIGPDWGRYNHTQIASGLPIYSIHNGNNKNCLTIASNEVIRDLNTKIGLREEGCNILTEILFFHTPEVPLNSYETKIRLDNRDSFWSQIIQDGVDWMTNEAGIEPILSPEWAFEPLYSTWYQFHQNVSDIEIEEECSKAIDLGLKTIIVDDGWQTDDNNRGYAFCGDWKVSKNRFKDFPSHVKKIQDIGLKYLLWYSLPLIGNKSKNYERFKDKFLYEDKDKGILDPRFPDVREFLIGIFENAMNEYGLDGFKLDFIDRFNINDNDPAVAENYAGRDIKALPEAVNVLMKDIYSRLHSINPNVLIEFRQSYMGPAIRQYGNILRAGDCPGDLRGNRQRIATLRLTSGKTAVHGDMLEWNVLETPENAARNILSSMFGVVQYSLMLRDLPDDHLRMVKHWYSFLDKHRETLLFSNFKPFNPESGYPMIEAYSDQEKIITVYQANFMIPKLNPEQPTYIINGTGQEDLFVELEKNVKLDLYNTFGEKIGDKNLNKGVQKISVPISGYIYIKR